MWFCFVVFNIVCFKMICKYGVDKFKCVLYFYNKED